MILDSLLVVAMAITDRLRGKKGVFVYLNGLVVALIFSPTLNWIPLAIIATFVIGEMTGWGTPLGAALTGRDQSTFATYEKWQKGPLRTNPWLSLAVRGAMWGLPSLVLLPWVPTIWLMVPVYALAMPLAVLLANKAFSKKTVDERWGIQEVIRGGLVGLLLVLLIPVIGAL